MADNAAENFYVVAIGASAGGLEAFSRFFDNARLNDNIAYILIQHLAPDYKSLLAELLSKHTRMKVIEAEHDMPVQGNHVYVIPPKKNMTVIPGMLQLDDKNPNDRGPNTSIDTFFNSLAEAYEEKAIAVVLSGTGSDGSRGIEAIKQSGGFVVVQDPEDAKFDGMPRSSIATGCADLILPVQKIYHEIMSYIKGILTQTDIDTRDKANLKSIFAIIESHTGCDFQSYKLPTILRRLNKRLASLRLHSLEEYIELLHTRPNEADEFLKDLLIGVTKFFRDQDAFDSLYNRVLVPLVTQKKEYETIKIWVTACSTGEEAYTIAILLDDLIRRQNRKIDVKIYATDLNTLYIDKASKAVYDAVVEKDIPAELFKRYFIRKENTVTIVPAIRRQIVFARHNIITDPPFIKNDLVTCRNMLIYMDQHLQRVIFAKFAFAINPSGFLFLGPSEQVQAEKGIFLEVERKWKIFQKCKEPVKLPYSALTSKKERIGSSAVTIATGKKVKVTESQLESAIFEDLGIVSFLIDSNYTIHETFGNYQKYVSLKSGELENNLLNILPPNLSIALNSALLKVDKSKESMTLRNIIYRTEEVVYNVTASVRPPSTNVPYTTVTIAGIEAANSQSAFTDLATDSGNEVMELLKAELRETRFNLQTTIEELETTNEELQSGNEELLSANEELQSSNEELQSLNEELHTLNSENQMRIKELAELNDDLNNYFKGSNIGQVILDRQLQIRKFNPMAAKMINVIDRDISRSINDITRNFTYYGFDSDIQTVLKANKIIEKELTLDSGKTVLLRISSYLTNEGYIDGALLSFIDITEYKELYNIIDGVFKASQAAIVVLQPVFENDVIDDFKAVAANSAASSLLGISVAGKQALLKELHPSFRRLIFKDLAKLYESGRAVELELEMENRWLRAAAVKIPNGVALTIDDITRQKSAEIKLRKSYIDMYASKEQLREVNQNLEVKIAQRTKDLATSEERFRLVSKITNDVVVDWDFANSSFWVSDNYYKLFGYNISDVQNNREFWVEKIHPDDRKRYIDTINESMKRTTGLWSVDYRYLHRQGSYRTITDRGFFLTDENGTPYRMLSSMLDITELKTQQK